MNVQVKEGGTSSERTWVEVNNVCRSEEVDRERKKKRDEEREWSLLFLNVSPLLRQKQRMSLTRVRNIPSFIIIFISASS